MAVVKLVKRMGALCRSDINPMNVYKSSPELLSTNSLDSATYDAGSFLINKYACENFLMGLKPENCPSAKLVHGPKELKSKLRNKKSYNS